LLILVDCGSARWFEMPAHQIDVHHCDRKNPAGRDLFKEPLHPNSAVHLAYLRILPASRFSLRRGVCFHACSHGGGTTSHWIHDSPKECVHKSWQWADREFLRGGDLGWSNCRIK